MHAIDLHREFNRFADALEILGANPFRVRSYRRVAQLVLEISDYELKSLSEKELQTLPGIGESLSKKIVEYRDTGTIETFTATWEKVPSGLFDLLKIPTLGPKSVRQMWTKLGITDQQSLLVSIESGELVNLYGFGEKKVRNIRNSLDFVKKSEQRIPFAEAEAIAEELLRKMRLAPGAVEVAIAGSIRRKAENIGDIDLVVKSRLPRRVISYFVRLPDVVEVIAQGTTKASVRIAQSARQVDIRVVPPQSFGAALQYFTGNKQHNIDLRNIAQQKEMKLSEYGLYLGSRRIAGETEESVYRALNVPMVSPEERLGKGEVREQKPGLSSAGKAIKNGNR